MMVGAALLAARLALAAVFVAAGLAKLADREGARRAAEEFGAPARLAGPLAVLVPLAELAAGVLLLPAETAWLGAAGALALLIVFTAAIGAALARGRAPDCHCFGQLHSAPAGAAAVVRNGALALLACAVLIGGWRDPGPSAVAWIAGLDGGAAAALAGWALALLVLGAGGWAFVHVLSQHGRLLLRLERLERALAEAGIDLEVDEEDDRPALGLPVGAAAPDFELPDLGGRPVSLGQLREAGTPVLLLFTDPACGPCASLLPQVAAWQRELAGEVAVVLVAAGSAEENRAKVAEQGLTSVLVDEQYEVYRAYGGNGTPSAVLVAPDGTIASPVRAGATAIERLVEQTLEEGSEERDSRLTLGLRVGEELEPFRLPDLEGREVSLADLLGRRLVLVHWSPDCGFCERIAPELATLTPELGRRGTELVLVAHGEREANRALAREHGLAARILLQNGSALPCFDGLGTPVAYLVDEQARVAAPLAIGAEAVPELARRVASGTR